MSPQAHARVDEKHFQIVGQLFQIPSESSESCFHLFESRTSSERWPNFFIYKRSLVISKVVCCNIFESFCTGKKAKIPQRFVCKVN